MSTDSFLNPKEEYRTRIRYYVNYYYNKDILKQQVVLLLRLLARPTTTSICLQ
jgi:hypothetical protein